MALDPPKFIVDEIGQIPDYRLQIIFLDLFCTGHFLP